MELFIFILSSILLLNPAQRSECSVLVSSTIFTPLQPSIELFFDLNTKATTYATKSVEEATQSSLQQTSSSVVSTNELVSEIETSPEHKFAACKSTAKDTVFTPLQASTGSLYELHEKVATRATRSVKGATHGTIQEALSSVVSTDEFGSKTSLKRGFATALEHFDKASQTGDHVEKNSKRHDQGPVMLLGSLRNVRTKRDTEYGESADSTNAEESVQDDTPYLSSQEEPVVDESPSQSVSSYSSSDAQSDTTDEEDSGSRSEEESADQLYPAGIGSSDDELRDEWDSAEIPEGVEQGRGMSHSRYQWSLAKRRTWTGTQNHPKRNFIRVPVFPGK